MGKAVEAFYAQVEAGNAQVHIDDLDSRSTKDIS
jgi:hypothetical protein